MSSYNSAEIPSPQDNLQCRRRDCKVRASIPGAGPSSAMTRLKSLTPGALVNATLPRSVINVFHRLAVSGVIASFPKTGNTWFGLMLRHLIVDAYGLPPERIPKLFVSDHRPSQILNVQFGIPLIYHNHFIPYVAGVAPDLGDMLETIAPFRKAPMLVLIRNPKDIMVSAYMEHVSRDGGPGFRGTIAEFVADDALGVRKFVRYYNALALSRRTAGGPTLIVRYEDLWSDAAAWLRRGAEFLGVKRFDDDAVRRAVAACSFENMRRIEDAASRETAPVPGLFNRQIDDNNARRVRVGGSSWENHLSADTASFIDAEVERDLDGFFRT